MGNSDCRILDKNLCGGWKAKDVRDTIGDEAASRHHHHCSVRRSIRNADERQGLAYYRHLFGVSAGADFDCASTGNSIYRQLDGGVVSSGPSTETNGNWTRSKRLSAECGKHDQSQARERERTGRVHLIFLRASYS